jgi:hypothetical protein
LIAQALSVIDSSIDSELEEDYAAFGKLEPAACVELEQLLLAQLGVLDTNHNKEPKTKVVHYRIGEAPDDEKLDELNEMMEKHTEEGNICILSGDEQVIIELLPSIPSLTRRSAHELRLPDLTVSELALLTLHLIQRDGYDLLQDANMPVNIRSKLDLMILIVSQVGFITMLAYARTENTSCVCRRTLRSKSR